MGNRLSRKALDDMAAVLAARREAERQRREERGRTSAQPAQEARGNSRDSDIPPPTAEQMRAGIFEIKPVTDKRNGGASITIGKAYRRKPMIETLHEQGILSDAEHKALQHYRHHADIADKSLVRDSLGKRMGVSGGNSDGPTRTLLNAMRVRDDCERAAGSLVDMLRAVVVYDQSLSAWAIEQHGGLEECKITKDERGKVISRTNCRWKAKPEALKIVRLEIQVAAQRVQSELDA